MEFIKKYLKLIILILVILILVVTGVFIFKNRNPYKNEGFKGFYYRVYQNGKWSKWCKNGDICGKKNKPITNIEIKTGDSINGKLLYNVYKNGDLVGMNSVDQKLLDTTSHIEGFVLTSSDDIFENYKIYYRTYNAKYGWMAYSDGDEVIYGGPGVNGAKGFPIEQLQIIILKKDSKMEIDMEDKNPTNFDFNYYEEDNSDEQSETVTENAE